MDQHQSSSSSAVSAADKPACATPQPKVSDTVSVNKRLKSELTSLMMSGCPGISAFPESDCMLTWLGTIEGAPGTVYENLQYKLRFKFPTDYPFRPPVVTFETPVFHPNVSTEGEICLDILKEKWSAVYNVQTLLLSLQSLLGEPNNASPLNVDAAKLWSNQDEYKKHVMRVYRHPDA